MQRIFGPMMQNAFLVDDLDATLDYWNNTMGVGPFHVFEHVQFAEAYFRGKPSTIDMTAAIAYWGDVQIEFIKQHNSAPSIFTEFRDKQLRGMQHMGVVTQDLAGDLRRLELLGIEPVQWGSLPTGMQFAYVSSDFHPGGMIELIQPGPQIAQYFDMMKTASAEWDGTNGIIRV